LAAPDYTLYNLLLKQAGEKMQQRDASPTPVEADTTPFITTAKTLATNPGAVASTLWNTLTGVAKSAGQGALNAAEAINPLAQLGYHIPNAENPNASVPERAGTVANAAFLGIPGAIADMYAENYGKSGYNKGVGSVAEATARTAYELSPLNDALKLLSAKDIDGRKLSAEELTQAGMGFAIDAIPALWGLKALKKTLWKGVTKAPERRILTRGQIQGALDALGDPSLVKEVNPDVANTVLSVAENKAKIDTLLGNETLMKRIVDKASLNPDRASLIGEAYDTLSTAIEQIKEGVEGGLIRPGDQIKLARDMGIEPDMLFDSLIQDMGQLKNTAGAAGRVMHDFSRLNRSGVARRALESMRDLITDPAKLKQIDDLIGEAKPLSLYSRSMDLYKRFVLNPERAFAVSGVQTAARNAEVQGAITALGIGEELMSDMLVHGLDSKLGRKMFGTKNDIATIADHYAGTKAQLFNALHTFGPKHRASLAALANELPYEKALLGSSTSNDVILRGALDKAGKEVGAIESTIQKAGDWANILNHTQEQLFKRMNYQGRLEANLARLGYKSLDEVLPLLQSKHGLSPELNHAFVDASDYALRNTFSATPAKDTFGGAILQAYKAVPPLAHLGSLFPRFLVNSFDWLERRNPLHANQLFSAEFRDQLLRATDGRMAQREAAEVLGRAATGMALFSAATAARALPQHKDLKYYQLFPESAGDPKKGDIEVYDARGYQPLTQYLGAVDMLKAWANGKAKPDNMTSSELSDLIIGIRNSQQVPMFMFDDILKQMDSKNPSNALTSIARTVGQHLSAPLALFQSGLDITSAVTGNEKLVTQKDTSSDPLFGPAQARLPQGRDLLPDRIDPLATGPAKTEHPGLKQMGVNIARLTPMTQLSQQLGLSATEMIGTYDNPEADALVQKHFAEFISQPLRDGRTVGKLLQDETLKQQGRDAQIDFLRMKVLPSIRGAAVEAAKRENPLLFVDQKINSAGSAQLSTLYNDAMGRRETKSTTGPYDPLQLLRPRTK
jgi:hypothetical protein